jgi:muramidase (phage lysozyme)
MTIAYKDTDKCTDTILDFIAQLESRGNYNAVIGNAQATNDLGSRTIDQIYGMMGQLLNSGQPSTAVGRYQIIKMTMETLQPRLNLAGSDKFTPEVQDHLALQLLIGRGYQRWWIGQLSDQQFAHALSLEWASLPDPDNGGKSHYDGVGPNHALTTVDKVCEMLGRARAAKNPNTAAPTSPATAADGQPGPSAMEKSPLEWIKDIQTVLRDAGFYTVNKATGQSLEIDGKFGTGSKEALNGLLEAAHQSRI